MPLGTTVINKELPSFGATAAATGTAGIVGEVDAGPEGVTLVRTINEFASTFGARSSTSSATYDWAETFFALGGRRLYVNRPLNGSAATAKVEVESAGGKKALIVSAKYKGVAGNGIQVSVTVNGSNTYLTIFNSEGEVLEKSGEYPKVEELLTWGKTHETYVVITEGSEYSPTAKSEKAKALAKGKLTSGANPSTLTNTEVSGALVNFTKALGPMQVAVTAAMKYEEEVHVALAEHAANHEGRYAVGDIADSATVATLITGKGTSSISALEQGYIAFTSSTAIIGGLVPATTRKVAGSAVFCGLRAQVAAAGNNNTAAAGADWPVSPFVLSFTNTFNHTQQEELVEHGINVWGEELGVLCSIGWVSAVSRETDEIFWSAAAGAERQALTYEGGRIMQGFNFKTIDGQGHLIATLKGQLQALGKSHWEVGALFGEKASEACAVEVGEPFNTLASEQKGELNAELIVRISEYAQATTLTIVSRPITASVTGE